jgi:hypothetical protein
MSASIETSGNIVSPAPVHDPRGLPTFIVIGAMKSGTTSLFHYLQAHPQIAMSPLKEVDFFIEEGNWGRGLDWYRRQFDATGPETLAVGEASTSYTKWPEYEGVPERIARTLPDVRLMYVLRDPVERIRSHYQHRSLIGAERAPIETAVLEDPRYVDCSRYAMQIERYLPVVPRDRLLLLTSEQLRADRGATVARAYRFLGVDAAHVPTTLEQEFYTTQDRARYPAYVWWLRRRVKRYLPAGKRAKELVDLALPRAIARLGGGRSGRQRPADGDEGRRAAAPAITPALRSELEDRLRDDVRALRALMPEDFDGWGIA